MMFNTQNPCTVNPLGYGPLNISHIILSNVNDTTCYYLNNYVMTNPHYTSHTSNLVANIWIQTSHIWGTFQHKKMLVMF